MVTGGFKASVKKVHVLAGVVLIGALFILLHAESASAARPGGGRVEGVVISDETSAPVAGVEVWLDQIVELDSDPVPRRRALTDANGRFVFANVRQGRYLLYADKAGYLRARYPTAQYGYQQQVLTVGPGTVISDVQIGLRLGAKISGRVWDEQGQPINGLIVKLLALTSSGDDVSAVSIVSTRTDQEGQYLFEGLPAGNYLLRAERRTKGQARAQIEFAYYPDTESWQSATPLQVSLGDVLTDVDLNFNPYREQPAITGTITDAQTGEPLAGVSVSLVDGSNLGIHTKTAADGSYRLEGVPPGNYLLSAHGEQVGDGYEWLSEKLTVASGVNVIDFELSPAPLIAGTIEYIGTGRPPAADDFMISVRAHRGHRGINYNGQDRFEFRGLKPGPIRLGVGFSSLQYRLAAILLGDQDITGQTLELQPGDKLTDVRILITDDQPLDASDVQIQK